VVVESAVCEVAIPDRGPLVAGSVQVTDIDLVSIKDILWEGQKRSGRQRQQLAYNPLYGPQSRV